MCVFCYLRVAATVHEDALCLISEEMYLPLLACVCVLGCVRVGAHFVFSWLYLCMCECVCVCGLIWIQPRIFGGWYFRCSRTGSSLCSWTARLPLNTAAHTAWDLSLHLSECHTDRDSGGRSIKTMILMSSWSFVKEKKQKICSSRTVGR